MPQTRSIYERNAWRVPFILILITTAGLSSIAAWDSMGPGMLVVQVKNRRNVRLETVNWKSGVYLTSLGRIPPGESRMKRVTAIAEGLPWLYTTSADTTADSVSVPVYLQKRSKGFVSIEFLPGKKVEVKEWMTPMWDDVSR